MWRERSEQPADAVPAPRDVPRGALRASRQATRRTSRRTEWLLINPHLAVWGLAFLHWLPAILSIDAISRLGARIAVHAGPRTRRHGRAVANIARAFPALSHAEHDRIARGSWENFGRTIAESFIIDKIAVDESRVVCSDAFRVAARRIGLAGGDAEGKERAGGAIFVGLHYGNWEATVIPAARLGERPLGIYKPLRNSHADAYLRELRRDLFPGGLLPASPATLLKVARHVRDGGSMCMLADHRDQNGTVVPFFGHPAPSAVLPAMLSIKYGLPVFAARVDRLDGVRFSVHVEEVVAPRTGDRQADIIATTAAIQAVFERWITARPEHWVWFYNRWATVSGAAPDAAAAQAAVQPA